MATDYAATVATKIIAQLKDGTAPWVRPWQPSNIRAMPYNPTTGKDYRGFNAMWLLATAADRGYSDTRWMTYKQAGAASAQVMRGEKGTVVQYWKWQDRQPVLDENGRPVRAEDGEQLYQNVRYERPRVFSAVVFNAQQISGLPAPEARPSSREWERHQAADAILTNSRVAIDHQAGDRAFYNVRADRIILPERTQFKAADGYYATALHELCHSTGHPSRLARPDLGTPFGSDTYAREELRVLSGQSAPVLH